MDYLHHSKEMFLIWNHKKRKWQKNGGYTEMLGVLPLINVRKSYIKTI
jgi:hypothetical protein